MEEFILSAIFLACLFGLIILFAKIVSGVLSEMRRMRTKAKTTYKSPSGTGKGSLTR